MRPLLSFVSGLLLLAGLARAGEPSRELVVQLRAGVADTRALRASGPGALPAAVRGRFAALGVRATRALSERLALRGDAVLPEIYGFHPERIVLVEAPDSSLARSALLALESDAVVDWAERNVTRSVALVGYTPPDAHLEISRASLLDTLANDPHLRDGRQYALLNLGLNAGIAGADVDAVAAWGASVGSNAIKLAVADTGLDPLQPELGGLMPDGGARVVDTLNVTDDPDGAITDLYGHGTPVAGVMASRTNDGPHFAPTSGVAGVCGGDGAGNAGCRIVAIKVAPGHSGDASSFDIARAFMHAADAGARAMNLSFAGDAPSRVERMALTYALYKGCIPVCASGNSGFDFPTLPWFPACYARDGLAISVGASDNADKRTPFSSYPFGLDLVAPGLNVFTTFMTHPSYFGASYPGYVQASGTSFAAPHVAGAVGLLAAARPELSDTDFQHIIRESADDVGAPGFDAQTGHGRLNLARMLDRVRPEIGIWHDEIPADSFTVEGEGMLAVEERGGGGNLARYHGLQWSTRLAAYGTAAIPDSFLSVTGAWMRVAGTMAARGDFRIEYFSPSAEVLARDDESVTFRGYLYRVQEDSCAGCDDRYVPLAPSNVRFAFTVIGVVDRPPTLAITSIPPGSHVYPGPVFVTWDASDPDEITRYVVEFEPAGGGRIRLGEASAPATSAAVTVPCLGPAEVKGNLLVTAYDDHGHADATTTSVPIYVHEGSCSAPLATFRATPTPFTGKLSLFAPGAGELRVMDASGRLVRRIATSGGKAQWDGKDDRGTAAGAGIYWVRFTGAAGTATKRVVKLGR